MFGRNSTKEELTKKNFIMALHPLTSLMLVHLNGTNCSRNERGCKECQCRAGLLPQCYCRYAWRHAPYDPEMRCELKKHVLYRTAVSAIRLCGKFALSPICRYCQCFEDTNVSFDFLLTWLVFFPIVYDCNFRLSLVFETVQTVQTLYKSKLVSSYKITSTCFLVCVVFIVSCDHIICCTFNINIHLIHFWISTTASSIECLQPIFFWK